MADAHAPLAIELAETLAHALGLKDRIVAEAQRAARRVGDTAMDLAAKIVEMAVRPGESEHGDEIGAAIGIVAERALDPRHRRREILVHRPARRINPRGAADPRDDQPR